MPQLNIQVKDSNQGLEWGNPNRSELNHSYFLGKWDLSRLNHWIIRAQSFSCGLVKIRSAFMYQYFVNANEPYTALLACQILIIIAVHECMWYTFSRVRLIPMTRLVKPASSAALLSRWKDIAWSMHYKWSFKITCCPISMKLNTQHD